MPDAVESVQEIVRCGPAGNLETVRSVHRFELAFKGGVYVGHRREPDRKNGSAALPISHADGGSVHFCDTLDNCQSEPGATRPATVAAPESSENLLALGVWNTGAAIHDTQLADGGDGDLDRSPR